MFDESFPACVFVVVFEVEIGQDQSKVAQRAETTVDECSLTSCVSELVSG